MFGRRTPLPDSATAARRPGPPPLEMPSVVEAVAQPGSFWAIITGQAASTSRYSWTQINEGDTPTFAANLADGFAATGGNGLSDAPAYEIGGRTDVPVGTRVRIWPAGDLSYYLFQYVQASSFAAGGCGWVARLRHASCLRWRVLSSTGLCAATVTVGLNGKMTYGGGVWTSATTLTINGVDYTLQFSNSGCPGPCLQLIGPGGSAAAISLVLAGCSEGLALFAGGGDTLCPDGLSPPLPCSDNSFVIQVECISCEDETPYTPSHPALPTTTPAGQTVQFTIPVSDQTPGSPLRQFVLNLNASSGVLGIGQYQVTIQDPTGATGTVMQYVANNTHSNVSPTMLVTFSDNATPNIQQLTTTPEAFYQPAQQFALAFPDNPNGNWQVFVTNNGPDAGTVTQMEMIFGSAGNTSCCGDDFVPNNGTITYTNRLGTLGGMLPATPEPLAPVPGLIQGPAQANWQHLNVGGHSFNPQITAYLQCSGPTGIGGAGYFFFELSFLYPGPVENDYVGTLVSMTCPHEDPNGKLTLVYHVDFGGISAGSCTATIVLDPAL